MSNKVGKRLVPALRFPEFRQSLGWEPTRLGKIATFGKGKGISKAEISENGSLPCVRYGELYTRYSETIDEIYSYTNVSSDDLVLSHANDVIIPASGETEADIATASCVLRAGVALGSDLNIIRSKSNGVFLSYYLNSARKQAIAKLAQGISVVHLYSSQLKTLLVATPQVPEQEKVAACLSSLDDLITAQARKIEALKAHKKGLMQQLFPAEGETAPRLRFPEFRGTGAWAPLFVAQFAKVTTGAKDTQNKVDVGRYPFFVRSQTVERIDSFSYDGEAVLTSGDGVGVGKNFHYIKGKFDFHQRVYCIYDFSKDVSGLFFYLYFSEHFGERVMKMSAKNSVDSVRMAMIAEMPIMLPSLPEQQKIADCLSSLDGLITAYAQKLDALKVLKNGLMQGLFPSISEAEA